MSSQIERRDRMNMLLFLERKAACFGTVYQDHLQNFQHPSLSLLIIPGEAAYKGICSSQAIYRGIPVSRSGARWPSSSCSPLLLQFRPNLRRQETEGGRRPAALSSPQRPAEPFALAPRCTATLKTLSPLFRH